MEVTAVVDVAEDDGIAVFQRQRPMLIGLAYRLLANFADAEDVVQDAWTRWAATERSSVRSAEGFLFTMVSRMSIDRMRLAYRQRETYVGPWLPEPVPTDGAQPLGPAETVEQRETLSLAMMRVLQQLTAPERAVFVLREAFALPYADIGEALGLSSAHARQLHRRGTHRLADDRARFDVDPSAHQALLERFVAAASTGDRDALEGMLSHDVTLWTDGGGKASVALRPVYGPDHVSRLLLGAIAKHSTPQFQVREFNGQPGLLIALGARHQVCTLEVGHDSLVRGVQWMANPDKLLHAVALARW